MSTARRKPEGMEGRKETIAVLQDEIRHCRSDITSYNLQFMASTVLCAILAAAAGVLDGMNERVEDLGASGIFYILPTLYFFSLYNLVKYTNEQMKLGCYRRVLEHLLNTYLEVPFLQWEARVPRGSCYVFFGGIVQVLFYVPLAIVLLRGFYSLPHSSLWRFFGWLHAIQILIILVMAYSLFRVRGATLERLGYRDRNGNLEKAE